MVHVTAADKACSNAFSSISLQILGNTLETSKLKRHFRKVAAGGEDDLLTHRLCVVVQSEICRNTEVPPLRTFFSCPKF